MTDTRIDFTSDESVVKAIWPYANDDCFCLKGNGGPHIHSGKPWSQHNYLAGNWHQARLQPSVAKLDEARKAVLKAHPHAYADTCVSWNLWHIFAGSADNKGLSIQECEEMTTEAAAWIDAAQRLSPAPEAPAGDGKLSQREQELDRKLAEAEQTIAALSSPAKVETGNFTQEERDKALAQIEEYHRMSAEHSPDVEWLDVAIDLQMELNRLKASAGKGEWRDIATDGLPDPMVTVLACAEGIATRLMFFTGEQHKDSANGSMCPLWISEETGAKHTWPAHWLPAPPSLKEGGE